MDFKTFNTHRSLDPSDPGFTVPGIRLRWVSGRVREGNSSSGMWKAVKKSQLPEKLQEYILQKYPGAFSTGDTVRRGSGELILAYSTEEMVKDHRSFLDQKTKEQASRARILPKQEYISDKDYAKIEHYEGQASAIPSQFLKKKE